jgi:predicted nuclease of predicted toxin-antitoxin system
MKFIVDECTGPSVAEWLEEQGYEVYSVFEQARGMSDSAIITKAEAGVWILVTNDKDFGGKVHKEHRAHSGVILLRLDDERSASKIRVLSRLLDRYADQLQGAFVVATEDKVRVAPGA